MANKLKVLVLGGYGTFGSRVVRLLADEPDLHLIIAGRSYGKARGFAGTDIFTCRKLWLDDKDQPGKRIDVGYVGEVIGVNTAPLLECIAHGITPVISPTARGEDGKIYNCNADVAAAQAAIALKAKRLVFMSDVPGLMRDPKDPATLITHLPISEVPALKQTGVVDKGMIPKVDSAVAAIQSGVEKVQFVDGRRISRRTWRG